MTTTTNASKVSRGDVVFLVHHGSFAAGPSIERSTVISVRPDGSEVRVKESVGWHPASNCHHDVVEAIAQATQQLEVQIERSAAQLAKSRIDWAKLKAALENTASIQIDHRGRVMIVPAAEATS